MTDKNLTDAEIVKALKELLEVMLSEGDLQRSATISKALYLINRQKAENEELRQVAKHQQKISMDRYFEIKRLKEKIESLQAEIIGKLSAENERLLQKLQQAQKEKNKLMDAQMLLAKTSDEQQAEIERLKEDNEIKSNARANIFEVTSAYERGKSEARKEFAERLLSCYEGFDETNEVILFENLAKAIEDTKREMEASENAD